MGNVAGYKVSFKQTDSTKLASIPLTPGQFLFTSDEENLYLDNNKARTKIGGFGLIEDLSTQPNWSQTDSSAIDYIRNKPTSLPANGGTASTINTTLPISKGGTGQTTGQKAADALINSLQLGTDIPKDTDYYVAQYVNGGSTNTSYTRRPISRLYEYIANKLSTVATSGSYNDLTDKPTIPSTISVADASSTTKGIMKLYNAVGTGATDGTVDVAGIDKALSMKADIGKVGTKIYYGVCSTAASTAAKVVTLSGFSKTSGAIILIKFTNSNTKTPITLNINNTGAGKVYQRGSSDIPVTTRAGGIASGDFLLFYCNGTDYYLIGTLDKGSITDKQITTVADKNYPIMLSEQSSSTTGNFTTDSLQRYPVFYYNPYTKTLSVHEVNGNAKTATALASGAAGIKIVTQAEYDALPSSKTSDNIAYLING